MRNIIYNGNIYDPSGELIPFIRISPFFNSYLYRGYASERLIHNCQEYLTERFGNFLFLQKGRSCLDVSLSYYKLKSDDVVTILTTSGNSYVSSCVTKTIENYCKWSRRIEDKTKVIIVNHEFGYPFREWDYVDSLHIPVIEDCAYAFLTKNQDIGNHGDFALFSLPKVFPIQMGAILKVNVDFKIKQDAEVEDFILRNISNDIPFIESISQKRIDNFNYLSNGLRHLGISPFFGLPAGVVPGTFIFTWGNKVDYPHLRKYMEYHGIECSVFYGNDAFFIPINQDLSAKELDYMIDALEFYSKENKW